MFRPFAYLRDLFYPPVCAGCGKPLDKTGTLVCGDCIDSVELTEHAMKRGNKVEQLFEDIKKVSSAAAFAYYDDDSALRRTIHSLKYGRQPQIGKWLGQIAATEMLRQNPLWFSEVDAIVPVPLHPKKFRLRGYNQSEEIALGVAEVIGRPVVPDALRKVVDNATQTQMTIEQRRLNSQNVFEAHNTLPLRGKRILLIDDVVTTGSTLRDCIRCLTPLRGTTIQVMTIAVPRK